MSGAGNNSILDWISRYWFLILFLGGMAVTWGSFTTRINTIEAKQVSIEVRLNEASNGLNDVKGGIIRIETSLEFIKEKLDEK